MARTLYQTWAKFPKNPYQSQTWCIPKKEAEGMAETFREGRRHGTAYITKISVKKCTRADLEKDLQQAIEHPTMPKPAMWTRAAKLGKIPGG